ncbi:helix-turn-helix domain-containing protein [Gryllotalpicola protaetiae]|uniref:XRE family transcriptional regulator n=1 Tax=Gryllotalpicola protaetiae TaxID=2419771 RepID=A0A387BK36_9MICO|nr:helix-turn-helix transcriptional regulator [Gryllotalpicola protaetiae]AYG02652.1 XRE family transcriptional regulator [Gryllotalpicola protaetiae]
MTPSKKAFGQFVIAKRQAAGLTQRELADRVFITESAVSKWERGLSYPDITLVGPLAEALRVSEGELINASDDHASQQVEREARVYRRWRASLLWSTSIAYATTLVTCFIVNLSVEHTLSWYWVVVAAVALAFSLTTLPLLALPVLHRGWLVLGAGLFSLFALLAIVRLLYSDDGGWLLIAICAVMFAAVLVFGPIWFATRPLPTPVSHHRTVLALGADTVALVLLLLVIALVNGDLASFVTQSLPITAVCLVMPWVIALVIRYLPIAGLYRAGIAVAFAGVYLFAVLQPALDRLTGDHQERPVDLGRWQAEYINGNVNVLTLIGTVLIGAVLALAAALRGGQRTRELR